MNVHATAYNPPPLRYLRRYNVNRGMAGCCPGLGNGEFLEREAYYQRLAARRTAEIAAMTPEQLAAKAELDKQIAEATAWRNEWARGVEPGRNLGAMYLSPRGKILRDIIIRRDWPALFELFPLKFEPGAEYASGPGVWRPEWAISKYSFTGDGPNKRYVAWTEPDIRSWVFSPWYTVQPGYDCKPAQRELGIQAYMSAQNRHKQKFGPSSYAYVWPIYPGSGYGWQTFGCMADKDSWWVKNRETVVGAALVATAVFLGPTVIGAVTGGGEAAAAGTVAAGAAGAGEAVVISTTGVVAGTGTAAAVGTTSVAATGAVTAVGTTGLLATAQQVVGYVNDARTITAIVEGEVPPPPIGISGDSFTEWATDIAKAELVNRAREEAAELGQEYVERKISAAEEARIKAEIEALQAELAGLVPPGTPIVPSAELDPIVRQKIMEMQAIERDRSQMSVALLALGAGALFLMS